MTQKTAVFVDVQNIYYTTKQRFNRNFDYNSFWEEISERFDISAAFAYAIASQSEKQQQFQNILRGIGFDVKLKPFIKRSDGSAKGDWDVGIAIDMLEAAKNVDTLILASGDGDFDLLALKLKELGKTVWVYGVKELTADSLISAATHFRAIDHSLLL